MTAAAIGLMYNQLAGPCPNCQEGLCARHADEMATARAYRKLRAELGAQLPRSGDRRAELLTTPGSGVTLLQAPVDGELPTRASGRDDRPPRHIPVRGAPRDDPGQRAQALRGGTRAGPVGQVRLWLYGDGSQGKPRSIVLTRRDLRGLTLYLDQLANAPAASQEGRSGTSSQTESAPGSAGSAAGMVAAEERPAAAARARVTLARRQRTIARRCRRQLLLNRGRQHLRRERPQAALLNRGMISDVRARRHS